LKGWSADNYERATQNRYSVTRTPGLVPSCDQLRAYMILWCLVIWHDTEATIGRLLCMNTHNTDTLGY